ncbi:MAG: sigma-54-dependent Fis family transcriptional regulator [Calditrichaeota bacterium]|nr:MAG: sigma-54-dependent Fis family transcriptional regulator [Calditrichota bacterium]
MKQSSHINLLVIEDEDFDVRRIRNTLRPFEHTVKIRAVTSSGARALELMRQAPGSFDVVIMDFQIAGNITGEALIRRIKELDPDIQIIVVTKMTINSSDFRFANQLLEAGACWYCTKYPGDIEEYIYQPTDFYLSIRNAYERKRLEAERRRSERKLDQNLAQMLREKQIIGSSPGTRRLREEIARVAASEATVLIQGPSGTGKELVALNIHYQSARRQERFVPINCGSIPTELLESELFGFEKGAFTGAQSKKPGLFELAHRGTLFLDEVAELTPSAQVKLLRVLQEGELEKIGRTERIRVDVRIIAATNKDLLQEVQAGRFRQDLFYRLNVINLTVEPLSARPEDIPPLADYFLKRFSEQMNLPCPEISEEAMHCLQQYNWPGNVRELQNVIQRLLFCGCRTITAEHVKQSLAGLGPQVSAAGEWSWLNGAPGKVRPLREVERAFRKRYFQYVRSICESDAQAARMLGLAPPNYYRMCKELGLK